MKQHVLPFMLSLVFIGLLCSVGVSSYALHTDLCSSSSSYTTDASEYGIQWQQSYGTNRGYGARYEGPQPIGDCDNDGENEVIIGGRDAMLRIIEWDASEQTYHETYQLRCPFYPWVEMDADGFAIGDLTGDGENEIAVSWYATIHKWVNGDYKIIGWNPWVEWHGGGNPDCYIGDCDNDGRNELIVSCRDWRREVPEIVVFEWNGHFLVKGADWNDPGINGEVFMAGLGDPDGDGDNEIVLGSGDKVVLLNWNKQTEQFEPTILQDAPASNWEHHPFACVCRDSDGDGVDEIHVGYYSPRMTIFEWNGEDYEVKFEREWPGEGVLIEGLDVGDVDDDGNAEVCAGTDVVHILEWDGTTYVEEAVLPTFGDLAVVCIGDCDNDGKNEINVGSVDIDAGQEFMEWIFKYGWNDS